MNYKDKSVSGLKDIANKTIPEAKKYGINF